MAETGAEALARMILAKGRIFLVPSTKSFLYQGFSDKQHVVTLLPMETCSCSASDSAQSCVRRLAAVLGIGRSVDSPMPIKLRTRHLAAKRSGHKCAAKEHVQTGAKHQEEQSTVHQQVIDFYLQLKRIDLQVEGDVFIVDHFVAGMILHGDKVVMRKNTLSKYVNCRTHSAIVLDPTGSPNAESHMSENLVKHIRWSVPVDPTPPVLGYPSPFKINTWIILPYDGYAHPATIEYLHTKATIGLILCQIDIMSRGVNDLQGIF
ncbi:uncharacterized protein LOC129834214 isoform X2 [Salvelinus fontinalis]|uniref:uncharacterized protein LOC129834214 isoform X2 n=1 Tax=Salvelinus fontinalis TaxID=8038 RepID=UPI002485EAEA|nr:uncharacterized protein LOC129834214 isoform X2 [Salvelinus fontinalis]